MDRYIDADELYKHLCCLPDGKQIPNFDCDNFPISIDVRDVKRAIAKYSTAEVQPVVQGTWIKDVDDEYEFTYICSKCGSNCTSSVNIENNTKTMYRTKYCPNCGAKMGKEIEA